MSSTHFQRRYATFALALMLAWPWASVASAAPSAAKVSAGQARVERLVQQLESERAKSESVDVRLSATSAKLDRILAERQAARARLSARASGIYRSGNAGFVSVLLRAASFEDFATRWWFLRRMNVQDAQTIVELAKASVRVRATAKELLVLQEQSARRAAAVSAQLIRARGELAGDRAALAAYRARIESEAAERPRVSPTQAVRARSGAHGAEVGASVSGEGPWSSANCSHYGINFTGRGASGQEIGPYSMIVAHRTLPFGTLVEFEYHGKRAVARVADRGPHVAGREFDLGPGVARVLGFRGVDEVRYRVIGR